MNAACQPFDSLAARYDELWTSSAIGHAQRALVWQHLDPLFHPGQRILDIGCGTGADAAHFAARGIAVHAIDSSPAMIAQARRRGGFTADVCRAEEIATLGATYDGALSNFGALNCVADLSAVARALAQILRPGAPAALCAIGRFCLWELAFHPLRRLRGHAPSSLGFTVRYPTVRQIALAVAPPFRLLRWTGIGLAVPPSYVPLPRACVAAAAKIDRALAHRPLARALADHRLLILERL